jgi:hypothetical protein
MADITDVLAHIRNSGRAQDQVFEKAVNKGYYAKTPAGRDLYNVDLNETNAPGSPPGAALGSPLVPGQPYTTKQLQLANLYKEDFESNQTAAKGFKLSLAGMVTAGILALGSCFVDDDKPRHYMWSKREIEQPVDTKNAYKGIATMLAAGAFIAGAIGYMKRK